MGKYIDVDISEIEKVTNINKSSKKLDIVDKEVERTEGQFVGEVLPGQGWVELHGIFTVQELEALMKKIWGNYKELKDDNS